MSNKIGGDAASIEYFSVDIDLQKKVDDITKEYSNHITQEVKRLAPIDTGLYRKEISSKMDKKTGITYVNGKRHSITHLLEFGTQNTRPQPHFRPAFEKWSDKYLKALENIDIKTN